MTALLRPLSLYMTALLYFEKYNSFDLYPGGHYGK